MHEYNIEKERETVFNNKAAYIFCVYYFLFLFLKKFSISKEQKHSNCSSSACVYHRIGELGAKSLSSFYIFLKSWDFFFFILVFDFRELEECNVAAFF